MDHQRSLGRSVPNCVVGTDVEPSGRSFERLLLCHVLLDKLNVTLRTPSTPSTHAYGISPATRLHPAMQPSAEQYQKCEIALPARFSARHGFIATLLITAICHKFVVIVRIYSRQPGG